MDNIKQISKAFIEFHKECPEIPLDAEVKIKMKSGGELKFSYASLPGIIKAIKGKLLENGLYFMHMASSSGVVCRLIHESGEYIDSEPLKISSSSDAKQEGAAITYAKRYTLCAILGISAEDDNDAPQARKPIISTSAYNKAMERIETGELKVFVQCIMNFEMTQEQTDKMFQLALFVDQSKAS